MTAFFHTPYNLAQDSTPCRLATDWAVKVSTEKKALYNGRIIVDSDFHLSQAVDTLPPIYPRADLYSFSPRDRSILHITADNETWQSFSAWALPACRLVYPTVLCVAGSKTGIIYDTLSLISRSCSAINFSLPIFSFSPPYYDMLHLRVTRNHLPPSCLA
jgi:hypothetical protein